MKEFGPV